MNLFLFYSQHHILCTHMHTAISRLCSWTCHHI